MTDDRQPDHSDDPREQGVGQGLPETNPAGATPADGTERGPEADRGDKPPAPDTDAPEDGAPSKATGNPRAAGG
jgi:hypothetical protein